MNTAEVSAERAEALAERAANPLSLADFEQAHDVVKQVIQLTPVETSRYLSATAGAPVYLKCENLQCTGSYKIRGAYNRIASLTAAERELGVIAASAGNHAQGVAFAARELGIKATIFMPAGVAIPKLEATREYGAEVVLTGTYFEETLAAAQAFTAKTGGVFIPPFDHLDVVAGQGTIALELFMQVPDLDTIVVPIGGGGLAAGVAAAAKLKAQELGRSVRIVGVQAANASAYVASIAAGKPVTIPSVPTIADGISVYRPGETTFPIVAAHVDEIVTVSDDEIARALLVLLERAKLVAEPAGAVTTAALLSGAIKADGPIVVLVSGGNIDPLLMQRVIAHGLVAAERYLTLRIGLPDRPGQLAKIAEVLAEANANVIEVLHTRHGARLQITEVELEIAVETRGPGHIHRVLAALKASGFEPRVVHDA